MVGHSAEYNTTNYTHAVCNTTILPMDCHAAFPLRSSGIQSSKQSKAGLQCHTCNAGGEYVILSNACFMMIVQQQQVTEKRIPHHALSSYN